MKVYFNYIWCNKTNYTVIKKNVTSHFYVHVIYFMKTDQNSFFLKSVMSTKKQTNTWMHLFWTKRIIHHNTDKIQIIIDDVVYKFFYSLFAIAIKLTLISSLSMSTYYLGGTMPSVLYIITSINLYNMVTIITHIFKWGNWGTEIWHLHKITHLVRSRFGRTWKV